MNKKNIDISTLEAIKILKEKLDINDETIHYLYNYKDGEELIKHIANKIK